MNFNNFDKKNLKVIAFDCDGVLFDTKEANFAFYNEILNYSNKPKLTNEQFEFVHMHTIYESLDFLFKNSQDPKDIAKALEYRKNLNYEKFFKFMKIEPYLKDILEKLRKNNYKTAIATNRTNTMREVLIEFDLKKYFDLVVTALDVKNAKPHPDELLKILDYFKINREELIFIGDSRLDEMAARATGVCFIAYKNKALSADFNINSFKELENIIF